MSDTNKTVRVDLSEEDTQEGKYLTFNIANEIYGIEIVHIIEIINIIKITQLPDMPHFVKGVINLRGRVIPVLDIRLRFSMSEVEYTERTCIIVVNFSGVDVGLIVESVSEVIDIPEDKIQPPPSVSKTKASKYIKGFGKVDKDVFILLDLDRLLFEDGAKRSNN